MTFPQEQVKTFLERGFSTMSSPWRRMPNGALAAVPAARCRPMPLASVPMKTLGPCKGSGS